MTKRTDRCTGHCCEGFYLPFSPEELAASYYRWAHSREIVPVVPEGLVYEDIFLIHPMVRHLGFIPSPQPMKPGHGGDKPGHRYRCIHHNQKTGDCEIYPVRPRMCREYPYGRECGFIGCTWKGAAKATALGFKANEVKPTDKAPALAEPTVLRPKRGRR